MKGKAGTPNHHRGKATGYDLINGEYHIAPVYQEAFAELVQKRLAVEELVRMVNKHAVADLEQIVKAKNRWWDRIREDIGLDTTSNWEYHDGVIKKVEKIVKGE